MGKKPGSREEAEASFAKAQVAPEKRKQEGTAHAAEGKAVEDKTARLRALRLAKEAGDKQGSATAGQKTKPGRWSKD